MYVYLDMYKDKLFKNIIIVLYVYFCRLKILKINFALANGSDLLDPIMTNVESRKDEDELDKLIDHKLNAVNKVSQSLDC